MQKIIKQLNLYKKKLTQYINLLEQDPFADIEQLSQITSMLAVIENCEQKLSAPSNSSKQNIATPSGLKLHVSVYYNGAPRPKVVVAIVKGPVKKPQIEDQKTNADGMVKFEGLPEGNYVVNAWDTIANKFLGAGTLTLAPGANALIKIGANNKQPEIINTVKPVGDTGDIGEKIGEVAAAVVSDYEVTDKGPKIEVKPELEYETDYYTRTKDGIEFKIGVDLFKYKYNKSIRPGVVLSFGAEVKVEAKYPVKFNKQMPTKVDIVLSLGTSVTLAGGLVNGGITGRVPTKAEDDSAVAEFKQQLAEYANANIFGSLSLSLENTITIDAKSTHDLCFDNYSVELKGDLKVGLHCVSHKLQVKLVNFSLGKISVSWKPGKTNGNKQGSIDEAQINKMIDDMLEKVAGMAADEVDDFIEKNAPESVKKIALKAGEFIVKDPTSKKVSDGVEKAGDYLDEATKYIDEKLGTNLGPMGTKIKDGAEKVAQTLIDPDGTTSKEDTEKANKVNDDYHKHLENIKAVLKGKEKWCQFVDAEDYNKVLDILVKYYNSMTDEYGNPAGWKDELDAALKNTIVRAKKRYNAAVKKYQKKSSDEFAKIRNAAASDLNRASRAGGVCNHINSKAKKLGREQEAMNFLSNIYRAYQPWVKLNSAQKEYNKLGNMSNNLNAAKQQALVVKAKCEEAISAFKQGDPAAKSEAIARGLW